MTKILQNRCASRDKWVAVSVIVMALSACGGGGGGGITSISPAPVTPTLTPTPTPTSFAILAPERPSTGTSGGAILAGSTGPNFATGPAAGTVFPLLQTTMVYDSTGARADTSVNAAGGTATVQSGSLNLAIDGFQNAIVRSVSSGYANLDWTRVGSWSTGGDKWDYDDTVGRTGVFVTGYQTPGAAMPSTGTATYAGLVGGTVFYTGTSSGSTHCSCALAPLTGNASFSANFGTRNVSGSLTGMTADGAPWNDVAFHATIAGNAFSGTTGVTSAPAGPASLASTATGTIEGGFFGPAAQEAGAAWTLFDGSKSAIGTLTGKGP